MNSIYNNKDYAKYITEKYDISEKLINKILIYDSNVYIMMINSTTIYPILPQSIIMPLKKHNDNVNNELVLNDTFKTYFKEDIKYIKSLDQLYKNKIEQLNKIKQENVYINTSNNIINFFNIELKNYISDIIIDENITSRWISMYEILKTYNLFTNNTTFVSFHMSKSIHESFFALNYYLNRYNITNDYLYHIPQKYSMNNNIKNIDYGKEENGILNLNNIHYFESLYNNKKVDLVTGIYEGLFSQIDLYKLLLGSLITAIKLKPNVYIFNICSLIDIKMQELLYIACIFWKRVDIIKTLTIDPDSDKLFIICMDYIGGNCDVLEKYIEHYKNTYIIYGQPYDKFKKRIYNCNKLMTLRKITNINTILIRTINYEFIYNNNEIKLFEEKTTKFYIKHFSKIIF